MEIGLRDKKFDNLTVKDCRSVQFGCTTHKHYPKDSPRNESPRFFNIKNKSAYKFQKFKPQNYIQLKAYDEAEKALYKSGIVFLIGSPGAGKTTFGFILVARINENEKWKPLYLTASSEIDEIPIPDDMAKSKQRYIVLVDDIDSSWKEKFETIELLVKMGLIKGSFRIEDLNPLEDEEFTKLRKVCAINGLVSAEEIKQSANSLIGVYLAYDDDDEQFSFTHPSVFDAVFLHFSSVSMKHSIMICPASLLVQYVITTDVSNTSNIIVRLDKCRFSYLAKRITDLLQMSDSARSILSHPSLRDSPFVEYLIKEFLNPRMVNAILSLKLYPQTEKEVDLVDQGYLHSVWNMSDLKYRLSEVKALTKVNKKVISFSSSSVAEAVVVNELEMLSIHFATSIVIGNSNINKGIKYFSSLPNSLFGRNPSNCEQQQNLLRTACLMGNAEVADIVLKSGIVPTIDSFSAAAVTDKDDNSIFDRLFKYNMKLGSNDWKHLLLIALAVENENISKLLIKKISALPNSEEILDQAAIYVLLMTNDGSLQRSLATGAAARIFRHLSKLSKVCMCDVAFVLAAECNNGSILKEMFCVNSDLCCAMCQDKTLLLAHAVARGGCLESLAILMDNGCNISALNAEQKTALHVAVEFNQPNMARTLLGKGLNVNVVDGNRDSPLHMATRCGSLKSVAYLLENEAGVNMQDEDGNTPLHFAAEFASTEIVSSLVEKGAQVNIQNRSRKTALHLAVHKASYEILIYLIRNESQINQQDDKGKTPLHVAVQHRSMKITSLLVNNGANVNLQNVSGDSPVHAAAQRMSLEILSYLVDEGARVDLGNENGDTPIHIAAQQKSVEIVHYLVQKRAQVNLQNGSGNTSLHIAAQQKSLEMMSYLVQNGAQVNLQNESGNTSLCIAVQQRSLEIASYLVQNGAQVNIQNYSGSTSLHIAAQQKSLEIARYLVQNGAQVNLQNKHGDSSFHIAAQQKSLEIARYLVQNGVKVNVKNKRGNTPFHIAAQHNSVDILSCIVGHGTELNLPNKSGNTPLHLAIQHGSVETAHWLVEKGAQIDIHNENGEIALHLAAKNTTFVCENNRSLAFIEHLVQNGTDINQQDNSGNTTLHFAVQYWISKRVQYLLKKGAKVNIKNLSGYTPLHFAASHWQMSIVEHLVAKGADINLQNESGDTPLHIAAKNDLNKIKYFVKHGADINIKNEKGCTPIHIAMEYKSLKIVRYLVEKRAKVNIQNESGKTPLHLAFLYESVDIAMWLVNKGALVNLQDENGSTSLHLVSESHGSLDDSIQQSSQTTCVSSDSIQQSTETPGQVDPAASEVDTTNTDSGSQSAVTDKQGVNQPQDAQSSLDQSAVTEDQSVNQPQDAQSSLNQSAVTEDQGVDQPQDSQSSHNQSAVTENQGVDQPQDSQSSHNQSAVTENMRVDQPQDSQSNHDQSAVTENQDVDQPQDSQSNHDQSAVTENQGVDQPQDSQSNHDQSAVTENQGVDQPQDSQSRNLASHVEDVECQATSQPGSPLSVEGTTSVPKVSLLGPPDTARFLVSGWYMMDRTEECVQVFGHLYHRDIHQCGQVSVYRGISVVIPVQHLEGKGFKFCLCVFLLVTNSWQVYDGGKIFSFPVFIVLQWFALLVLWWQAFCKLSLKYFGDVIYALSLESVLDDDILASGMEIGLQDKKFDNLTVKDCSNVQFGCTTHKHYPKDSSGKVFISVDLSGADSGRGHWRVCTPSSNIRVLCTSQTVAHDLSGADPENPFRGNESPGFSNIKHKSAYKFQEFKPENYIQLKAYDEAEKALNKSGIVFLIGSPGAGKTTFGFILVARIYENEKWKPLYLRAPSEIDEIPVPDDMAKSKQRYIILVDDIDLSWKEKFETIELLVDIGLIKVIITSTILLFYPLEKSFSKNEMSCLSNSTIHFSLTNKEKLDILELLLNKHNIPMAKEDRSTAAEQTFEELGFPNCCKFFAKHSEAQKRGVDFFKRPLEYLKVRLDQLKSKNSLQYRVLLLVLCNQGSFRIGDLNRLEDDEFTKLREVCAINGLVSTEEIKQSANSLTGVYLAYDNDDEKYSFIHPSVFDAVFLHFSSESIKRSIMICPASLLVQYVITSDVPNTSNIIVRLEKCSFSHLAKRITDLLQKSDSARCILSHPSLKYAPFVEYLIKEFLNSTVLNAILSLKLSSQIEKEVDLVDQGYLHSDWNMSDWNYRLSEVKARTKVNKKVISFRSSSVAEAVVVNELEMLSIHFATSIAIGNSNINKGIKYFSSLQNSLFGRKPSDCEQQQNLLSTACLMGNAEVADILLNSGIVPTIDSLSAAAVTDKDDDSIFDKLFKYNNKLGSNDWKHLLLAALAVENENISKLLIRRISALPNSEEILDQAAMCVLLMTNDGTFQRSLVTGAAARIFRHLSTLSKVCMSDVAFVLAAESNNGSILKEMFSVDSDLGCAKCQDKTLLLAHAVARGGCLESLAILMDNGCNISALNAEQKTALHVAVEFNQPNMVKTLLKNGLNVNVVDCNRDSPLHMATRCGSLKSVAYLLENEADVNMQDDDGNTPLHFAAEYASTEIVSSLVEKGAQVNIQNRSRKTAIHLAVHKASCEILIYLIRNESQINQQDDKGKTPLHVAVQYRSMKIISLLVNNGANVNLQNVSGDSSVHAAAQRMSLEILSYLEDKGARVDLRNENGDTPIHIAAQRKSIEIVRYLVQKRTTQINLQNKNRDTALHIAVQQKSLEIASYLIQNGAQVNLQNQCGDTPFHIAAQNNSLEIVRYIVGHGTELNLPNESGNTPLHLAVQHGSVETARWLVEKGAKIDIQNENGEIALHLAPKHNTFLCENDGSLAFIEHLVQNGTDINQQDNSGNTTLHFAVQYWISERVNYLLRKGAKVNIKNLRGYTPLHFAVSPRQMGFVAVSRRQMDFVAALVAKGADVNQQNESGDTPLHIAAKNDLKKTKYLVKHGAEINIKNEKGCTPIHIAVENKSLNIVRYLVEKRAQVNIQNESGKTPLHLALLYESVDIAICLVNKGALVNLQDENGSTPLHLVSASHGSLELVKRFVKKGGQVNQQNGIGNIPLHIATQFQLLETVGYLVNTGSDINCQNESGKTPLHFAAQHESRRLLRCLVGKGAYVNQQDERGDTPLHFSALCCLKDNVIYLLENEACANSENSLGYTPLTYSCCFENNDIVHYLLGKAANVNHGNITAVLAAAAFHCKNNLQALLDKGGEVNVLSKSGSTPLHMAMRWDLRKGLSKTCLYYFHDGKYIDDFLCDDSCDSADMLLNLKQFLQNDSQVNHVGHLLLDKGCCINTRNNAGKTALHVCVEYNQLENLKFLLERGADVSLGDKEGNSVFHYAAARLQVEFVKTLVEAGAVSKRNHDGLTPSDLVSSKVDNFDGDDVIKYGQIMSLLS
ncbi:uncharacterized protein LOC121373015 [Gigantopelta aegis]|uniref:uncharacterized protein LOC121373015 n=1 Tax=Gigantopelta aegis TaxID=1735272 RepID=UPI001B88C122|nr:uncharacterized protein LOC121373015 [Gigantopelta aegis]